MLGPTCSNDRFGYQLSYPEGWFTSDEASFACEFFDPEPLNITPNTEVYGIAVTILPEPFARYGKTVSSFLDPTYSQVVSVDQTTVAGRRASLIETRATGNGFDAKGTMTYAYIVDRDGDGFVLLASGLPGSDYDTDKIAIDLMVGSLSFSA